MSLAELMPALRSLTREEQVELKQFLDSELSGQQTSNSDAAKEEELLRQLVAAAPLYYGPIETNAEGIRALEQVLADARARAK